MEYVWTTGKRLVINVLQLTRPESVIKELIILLHKVLQDRFYKRLEQELLSQERKIKIGGQIQCRRLQEGRRP